MSTNAKYQFKIGNAYREILFAKALIIEDSLLARTASRPVTIENVAPYVPFETLLCPYALSSFSLTMICAWRISDTNRLIALSMAPKAA